MNSQISPISNTRPAIVGTPSASPRTNIRGPSLPQLKRLYSAMVADARQNNTLRSLKKAPKNYKEYTPLDITPKHLQGRSSMVYQISGHLYLAESGLTPTGKLTNWYFVGHAPIF